MLGKWSDRCCKGRICHKSRPFRDCARLFPCASFIYTHTQEMWFLTVRVHTRKSPLFVWYDRSNSIEHHFYMDGFIDSMCSLCVFFFHERTTRVDRSTDISFITNFTPFFFLLKDATLASFSLMICNDKDFRKKIHSLTLCTMPQCDFYIPHFNIDLKVNLNTSPDLCGLLTNIELKWKMLVLYQNE